MEEPNEVIFGEGVGPSLPGVGERERPAIPRPMVFVALAFIAGLVLGRHLLVPAWWPIVAAAAIAFGLAASLYRTREQPAETPHSRVAR